MSHEVLAAVPPWLLTGLALGLLFAVVVAGTFLVGERLSSGRQRREGDRRAVGEQKRRQEIREYLQAIDEPYAEDHFVGGQHVAFYLPGRDVAVTFDVQAFFRIRNTDTHAVLCEHEMPGWHLGVRLPFEVPEVESRQRDVEEPIRAAFAALGLAESASVEEVTQAYRERVKEVHPDHGGDRETFTRVREAYATAKEHARGGSSTERVRA